MTDARQLGPGELAARKRARYRLIVLTGCGLFGGVLGAFIGAAVAEGHATTNGWFDPAKLVLSPIAATVLALGFVIGLVGLPVYFFGQVDELKVRRNLQSMTGGLLAVLGGYPAWQLLAAGRLVPQPSAFGIWLIGYFSMVAMYLVFKVRD
ncbi:hypothetical protein ACLB0R_01920 [Sphingomonas sp. GlSt437]|uniref:hypothetical protein n=1 Tax=Sphingomonas sp. GlSt437 TaxID=3389970 RepID=UPI003A8A8FBE